MYKCYKLFALLLAMLTVLSVLAGCKEQQGNGQDGNDEDESVHTCQSPCEECGGCKDFSCTKKACESKCLCEASDAYWYFPNVSREMAAIHINTADGNGWATRYTRESKLMGLIDYTDATVSTSSCEEEFKLNAVQAEVKVRGNYTLDYAKKPIRIKFKEKTGLLGLHEGEQYKNWVLLADWKDLSMMNNTVAFYLGNTILGSDGYYCTDFRNVEVYLNGEYWGVYLLVEQQEAKDGRVGLPSLPKNYTGNDIGYFFEYDAYYELENSMPDGDPTFVIDHRGIPAGSRGYTLKSDINAQSQLDFLQKHMNDVFFIAYQATRHQKYYKLKADGGVESAPEFTSAKEAIDAVIDLSSLVDTYILNEILCDLDVDWSSFYLSLDMSAEGNKKVTFEAPWDFDSSLGIINKKNCSDATSLYAARQANPWLQLVVGEDWFEDMVREKWAEIKAYDVPNGALTLIEAERTAYKNYYIKNYQRWSARVTYGNGELIPLLNTYCEIETAQSLAADYLTDWLTRRFAYLDHLWYDQ